MPPADFDAFVHELLGVNPADYPPSKAAAPPGAPAAGGSQPSPMTAECKPVHGKVPGPENHLLCATHGHVLDVKAKTIIAHDLADYVKHHPAVGHGGGGHGSAPAHGAPAHGAPAHTTPAPAHSSPAQAGAARGGAVAAQPDVAGAAPPPSAGAADPKAAPPPSDDAIALGIDSVIDKADTLIVATWLRLTNILSSWSKVQEGRIEEVTGDPGGLAASLGVAITSVIGVVVPAVGVVAIVSGVLVAQEQKGLALSGDALKSAIKESLLNMVSQVMAAQVGLRDLAKKEAEKALKALAKSDASVAQVLASHEHDALEGLLYSKLGFHPVAANPVYDQTLSKLNASMRTWLKEAAYNYKMAEMASGSMVNAQMVNMMEMSGAAKEYKEKFEAEWSDNH